MADMYFAANNNRTIPKEDKIFGINNRAKAKILDIGKENVINATIGALLDDNGELIVLSSVAEVFKNLSPKEFAEYAPISGTPDFREVIKKDAFGNFKTNRFTEAVVTPGGTGAIRNTISNYSEYGDKILIADWFWAPYRTIAQEIGRDIETFAFFNDDRAFNSVDFEDKVKALLTVQDRLVVILNTPAHNPTGYSLTNDDWQSVVNILSKYSKSKKVTLLVDMAYIDFAGDSDKYREFLPILETLPIEVLPVIAHSLSKGYTLYGMRCGAMICMAKTKEIADEFKSVCEFSSRNTWSNSSRAPQMILAKIYADPKLKQKADDERAVYRDMLIKRGKAFENSAKKCGLVTVPFDTGFFISIPCDNPDEVELELEKENIFLVPLAKGLRVSIASISEDKCKILPEKILNAMENIDKR